MSEVGRFTGEGLNPNVTLEFGLTTAGRRDTLRIIDPIMYPTVIFSGISPVNAIDANMGRTVMQINAGVNTDMRAGFELSTTPITDYSVYFEMLLKEQPAYVGLDASSENIFWAVSGGTRQWGIRLWGEDPPQGWGHPDPKDWTQARRVSIINSVGNVVGAAGTYRVPIYKRTRWEMQVSGTSVTVRIYDEGSSTPSMNMTRTVPSSISADRIHIGHQGRPFALASGKHYAKWVLWDTNNADGQFPNYSFKRRPFMASIVTGPDTESAIPIPADAIVIQGVGVPAGTLGAIGNWYVDFTNQLQYEKTGSSTWTARGSFPIIDGEVGVDDAIISLQPTLDRVMTGDVSSTGASGSFLGGREAAPPEFTTHPLAGYGPVNHPNRNYIVYTPTGTPPAGGWPIVVCFQMNFFVSGGAGDIDKNFRNVCLRNNIAVASVGLINASVQEGDSNADGSVGIFPSFVLDAKRAGNSLKTNAALYNINPDKMITQGYSSGSYAALSAVLSREITDNGYGVNLTVRGKDGGSAPDPEFLGALVFACPVNLQYSRDHDLSHPDYGILPGVGQGRIYSTACAFMGRGWGFSPLNIDGTSIDEWVPLLATADVKPVRMHMGVRDLVIPIHNKELLRQAYEDKGKLALFSSFDEEAGTHDIMKAEFSDSFIPWIKSLL